MEKTFTVNDHVYVSGKKYALNLNVYRNCHYHILNQMKVNFKHNIIAEHIDILTYKFDKVKITYTIIPNDKRLFDTKNVESIVDKFFCDALVECGIIPDDNYTVVSYGAPEVSEIVKNNCKKIVIKCEFF